MFRTSQTCLALSGFRVECQVSWRTDWWIVRSFSKGTRRCPVFTRSSRSSWNKPLSVSDCERSHIVLCFWPDWAVRFNGHHLLTRLCYLLCYSCLGQFSKKKKKKSIEKFSVFRSTTCYPGLPFDLSGYGCQSFLYLHRKSCIALCRSSNAHIVRLAPSWPQFISQIRWGWWFGKPVRTIP